MVLESLPYDQDSFETQKLHQSEWEAVAKNFATEPEPTSLPSAPVVPLLFG